MKVSKTTYAFTTTLVWNSINWNTITKAVEAMQHRIVQAIKSRQFRKAKSLQRILTNSFYAKLMAVRRVTLNKGKNTPGVDGVTWITGKQKTNAALNLRSSGYKAKPMRRVFIPKSNGKKRPLAIPTLKDRAMQALFLFALDPWHEVITDPNSYGFRKGRACQDAIEHCFTCLSRKVSAKWVLDADIKACFDEISHQWLLENIPIQKKVLNQWLKAGIIHKNMFNSTTQGTPQGGIISPLLANFVLDGLEYGCRWASVQQNGKPWRADLTLNAQLVNVIRYADDFIVTARSKEILEQRVIPFVKEFLKTRGLELSAEKTQIRHVEQGFDFLGHNIKMFDNNQRIIQPSKKSVQNIMKSVKEATSKHKAVPHAVLIELLNPKITGWANFFKASCAYKSFAKVDSQIFHLTWRWAKRRHNNKNTQWIKDKYFPSVDTRKWCFQTQLLDRVHKLKRMEEVRIIRHVKVRNAANVYDKSYKPYFLKRKMKAFVKPRKSSS
ncbi:MAG: RNA-directed DNA polymerase [Crocinitomicaceae bacterium]|jgi:RNA-directed DNA polymerase